MQSLQLTKEDLPLRAEPQKPSTSRQSQQAVRAENRRPVSPEEPEVPTFKYHQVGIFHTLTFWKYIKVKTRTFSPR